MNIEEINEVIAKYDKLIELANAKAKFLEGLDDKYHTSRRIEDISLYDGIVDVTCDNSFRGCHDTIHFSFPVAWLTKTDDELIELVIAEKKRREENARKVQEEKQLREKEEKEKREREKYEQLKKKFEGL
jgi:hypothetical protein